MGGTNRICPGCGASMEAVFNGDMTIDVCSKCEGAFFDFKELPAIIDNMRATADVSKDIIDGDDKIDHGGKRLICADCQSAMTEKEYLYDSGVYINFCDRCFSVYLDKGELDEIKNFMASLDQSEEGQSMDKAGIELASKVKKEANERYLKLRKDVDDMYWTDNLIGMNRVVDYILTRFF